MPFDITFASCFVSSFYANSRVCLLDLELIRDFFPTPCLPHSHAGYPLLSFLPLIRGFSHSGGKAAEDPT